ncbi:enoyl-CoA hydratase [soil metagenome]
MDLESTVDAGVALLRLNRPDDLNCISSDGYGALADAVGHASADSSVDVIHVTARGRAFSTGGDLKQILTAFSDGDAELRRVTQKFADNSMRAFQSLESTPKTVVAGINGICQAGGLSLVLCSDISIASDRATFSVPEGLVGLADPFAPARLARRVGTAQAKWLLMTAESIDAQRALDIGLINQVVSHDDLEEATNAAIAAVQATSPVTRGLYKKCVNDDQSRFDSDVMLRANITADAHEGVRAFVAKEKPVWPSRVRA